MNDREWLSTGSLSEASDKLSDNIIRKKHDERFDKPDGCISNNE